MEEEEEVMMMMISTTSSSSENPTFPTWKLYENPFYYSQPHHHHHHKLKHQYHCQETGSSLWDPTLFKPVMETSEVDISRAQILELKAKLEYERKARKKLESLNKRLAKDLIEERRAREALEKVCQELAREITSDKAEIDCMKREIEEERKMLRVAEVLREERVQMKLSEAKVFLEEKIQELEISKQRRELDTFNSKLEQMNEEEDFKVPGKFKRFVLAENYCVDDLSSAKASKLVQSKASPETEKMNQGIDNRVPRTAIPANSLPGNLARLVLAEKSYDNISSSVALSAAIQRRASPEPENPHIKRGIKGFVEFPRVVRAIGSKTSSSSRHWGSKLECQKAQLRILLKQKRPTRSNNLIIG
ncbi:Branchless trichome [Tripterygium wilfordii]|uniref:Branchless trichome n=1 Tax=Tripterygium wilfordii TaxID=458696 RepID=A0A7J7CLL9_TRIWF|nr:uncharacterized protein LOC120016770 [Tripterygium wilfordii]KAF5734949.1 Branchless trichome [Tripterygium wilfordii]